jgi:Transcriptional regulator
VATHVPLTALPAFEATVRLGAMSAAAEELGRTPGAISKQIAQLEAALGARLFERAGRGLRPTPEGAAYARAFAEALEGLRRAGERIGESGRGRFVLRLSGALAARWLIPRLPAFQEERPDAAV